MPAMWRLGNTPKMLHGGNMRRCCMRATCRCCICAVWHMLHQHSRCAFRHIHHPSCDRQPQLLHVSTEYTSRVVRFVHLGHALRFLSRSFRSLDLHAIHSPTSIVAMLVKTLPHLLHFLWSYSLDIRCSSFEPAIEDPVLRLTFPFYPNTFFESRISILSVSLLGVMWPKLRAGKHTPKNIGCCRIGGQRWHVVCSRAYVRAHSASQKWENSLI